MFTSNLEEGKSQKVRLYLTDNGEFRENLMIMVTVFEQALRDILDTYMIIWFRGVLIKVSAPSSCFQVAIKSLIWLLSTQINSVMA